MVSQMEARILGAAHLTVHSNRRTMVVGQVWIIGFLVTIDAEQAIAITMINQLEARIIAAAILTVHVVWEQSMYCWITFKSIPLLLFIFLLIIIILVNAVRFPPISCNDVSIVSDTSFLYMA